MWRYRGDLVVVVGVLRRLFSKPTWGEPDEGEEYLGGSALGVGMPFGPPGSFDFDELLARIDVARDEIDRLRYRLEQEIGEMKLKAIKAIRAGDRDTAETIAADIVVKKKLLKGLTVYSKLLALLKSRLKTAKDLTSIAQIAGVINGVSRIIEGYAEDIGAEWVARIVETQHLVERITSNNLVAVEHMPERVEMGTFSNEISDELAQIFKEAHVESESLVSDVPGAIDYEVLEEKLVEYIRANNGVLSIKKAARELGVSPKIVKEVLYRLAKKGVIKVSKSGGRAEATPA